MSERCFLVTGAQGFIGSWVVGHLITRGERLVGLDRDDRPARLALLLAPEQLRLARLVPGDINDPGLVEGLIREHGVSHVVHLAGLQTPECRANPILGADVNVVGSVTVFQAVKACRDQVRCVVYASSGAVLGSDDDYPSHPIQDDAPRAPATLYGVFKTANEDCARIYFQEHGLRSVGLRPPVVYGVGRDRGFTAGTTLAIRAALLGEHYQIGFGGEANVEYAEDAARCFVDCALAAPEGALAFNMLGEILGVEAMIRIIEEIIPRAKGRITCVTEVNQMANHVSDAGLQALIGPFRPLGYREGARRTAEHFQRLLREGRLEADGPLP